MECNIQIGRNYASFAFLNKSVSQQWTQTRVNSTKKFAKSVKVLMLSKKYKRGCSVSPTSTSYGSTIVSNIVRQKCFENFQRKSCTQHVGKIDYWSQFTIILCAAITHPDPKTAKKDSQFKQLSTLLGSVCVKAACKQGDEIDPRSIFLPIRVWQSIPVF